MLDWLQLKPLFDLDLRLGEGTGAALGMSMAEAACKVLAEMATFGEAGVSEKE
jgi:nicotinate-nucleotide--dimethylbenzimidazole phosphoribosyltransferase